MQDIINELGMLKGAIYHPFVSKEEILRALGEYYYDTMNEFVVISNATSSRGLEKIRTTLRLQISNHGCDYH